MGHPDVKPSLTRLGGPGGKVRGARGDLFSGRPSTSLGAKPSPVAVTLRYWSTAEERRMNAIRVSADVVILAALGVAVASRRVSQLARPVIATLALACAWLIAAGSAAMQAPGWTMFLGGVVIVASIAVATATLHVWTQGGDGGDIAPGERGAHGGGGPGRGRPDAPQPGAGGSAPDWWPEYERQFALHVAEREIARRRPAVRRGEPAPDGHGGSPARLD
jgi:hypothetical protein